MVRSSTAKIRPPGRVLCFVLFPVAFEVSSPAAATPAAARSAAARSDDRDRSERVQAARSAAASPAAATPDQRPRRSSSRRRSAAAAVTADDPPVAARDCLQPAELYCTDLPTENDPVAMEKLHDFKVDPRPPRG